MKKTKEIKVNLDILRNMIYALIIALYFILLILCEKNVEENLLLGYIKVSSMVFLLITIYIFEKAYKEDSGKIALHSMEFFVLSINVILIEYLSSVFKTTISNYIAISTYTFLIYYVIKSMIIYTKFRKEQLDNLSDIAEIVKEEPTKKEPTKKEKTKNLK